MKECDIDSTVCFVKMTVGVLKQVYDGVFNSSSMVISKMQGVLIAAWLFGEVNK